MCGDGVGAERGGQRQSRTRRATQKPGETGAITRDINSHPPNKADGSRELNRLDKKGRLSGLVFRDTSRNVTRLEPPSTPLPSALPVPRLHNPPTPRRFKNKPIIARASEVTNLSMGRDAHIDRRGVGGEAEGRGKEDGGGG